MFDKKAYIRKWRKENPEYRKQYYIKNKEKALEQCKQYRKNNPEKRKICQKQWVEDNPDYNNEYQKHRYKTDLKFNINNKMRKSISKSLKGNKGGRYWEDLVGYTLKDLIKRLKKTIPKGYDWNDFLDGKLHVDHIIPISAWNYDNPGQINFRRCWALSNLQLLPAKENILKSNKLTKPFQPALKI